MLLIFLPRFSLKEIPSGVFPTPASLQRLYHESVKPWSRAALLGNETSVHWGIFSREATGMW